MVGDVGRIGRDEVELTAECRGEGGEPSPVRHAHADGGRAPDARQVGAGDGKRVLGRIGRPHVSVGHLDGDRQGDRSGPGAEVGDEWTLRVDAP